MKISVIVPIYNVEKYIRQCIDSIVSQTYKNLEIILVNDGSIDGCGKILDEYAKIDFRVKVINKTNGGLSSARNAGISCATGDYIYHVDGDDFIPTDAIEFLYDDAKKNDVDVVIGDINLFHEKKGCDIVLRDSYFPDGVITGRFFLENHYFTGMATNSVCNKLWRRSLYLSNDIFHPEGISLGEDGCTLTRLMLNAKRVSKINRIVYNYRQSDVSMTKVKNKKLLEYKKAMEIAKEHFVKNGEEDLIKKYELLYKWKLLYVEVVSVPYVFCKIRGYSEHELCWKYLIKDVDSLLNCVDLKKIISVKMYFLLNLYSVSVFLGDFFNLLRFFIIKIKA